MNNQTVAAYVCDEFIRLIMLCAAYNTGINVGWHDAMVYATGCVADTPDPMQFPG